MLKIKVKVNLLMYGQDLGAKPKVGESESSFAVHRNFKHADQSSQRIIG